MECEESLMEGQQGEIVAETPKVTRWHFSFKVSELCVNIDQGHR